MDGNIFRKEARICMFILGFWAPLVSANGLGKIPDNVAELFENKCAFSGCHAGPSSGNGLDLTENLAYASLVAQPSSDFPNLSLVEPGQPTKSYLIMKMVGVSGIKGSSMPKGDQPLSKEELRAVANWIKSISPTATPMEPKERFADSFVGLSLATLQTAETVGKGGFSYRIAHRWLGQVDQGFNQFFGLDAGAHMLTEFSFPLSDRITFTTGRSGTNSTFEFNLKYQLWRERTNNSTPISLSLYGGVDWLTLRQIPDPQNPAQRLSLGSGERFPIYGQLVATKNISNNIAILLNPGVVFNGNVNSANEDPILSLGFGGKVRLTRKLSVFVEGVSLLTGSDQALPVGGTGTQTGGQPIVFDAMTIGLEHSVGGHVFHLYVSNSLGLTTSQIMNGANLDFAKADFRLGFNIYRILRF